VGQRLTSLDYWLLGVALLLGASSTLRRFGVEMVTVPASAMLAAAAMMALRPLIRLFGSAAAMETRSKAVIGVIFGAHLVATLYFFTPEDILNSRPVLSLDHALHFYQAERAKEVFTASHRFEMYDPFFMAGHPGGMIFDLDSKGVELWCALLRFVDTRARTSSISFSSTFFFRSRSMPVVAGCVSGVRNPPMRCSFCSCTGIGEPYASHFRFAGMFSYVLACHLSFYCAGLFRSFLDGGRAWRFFVLGL